MTAATESPVPSTGPSPDRVAAIARRRRERWATLFRPPHIGLLIVAEAPPADLDRYFYFPTVSAHDALFRYVARSVLTADPTRQNKRELLERLRDKGVYLIDVSIEPVVDHDLRPFVPGLVRRIRKLQPQRIVLVKANVYDAAFTALRTAGLPVVDVRVPFPGSGQQARFEAAFFRALSATPVGRQTTAR